MGQDGRGQTGPLGVLCGPSELGTQESLSRVAWPLVCLVQQLELPNPFLDLPAVGRNSIR